MVSSAPWGDALWERPALPRRPWVPMAVLWAARSHKRPGRRLRPAALVVVAWAAWAVSRVSWADSVGWVESAEVDSTLQCSVQSPSAPAGIRIRPTAAIQALLVLELRVETTHPEAGRGVERGFRAILSDDSAR